MGKYKQWLHHQEIGRRLRDQINTLEQERARVQKMMPVKPTSLPETDNPMIAALLAYTRSGNKLSNIDVIKAAMPVLDVKPGQLRATSGGAASGGSTTAPKASGNDPAVVASLMARADGMPSDPLDQMREMSGDRGAPGDGKGNSVGGWWQQQKATD